MAALDLLYDPDSDESASSDISVEEFTDEFARHFFDVFGEHSAEEEEEFAGFHFEMPNEVEWAVLGVHSACCTEWPKFGMGSDICRGTAGLCPGSLILSYLYK